MTIPQQFLDAFQQFQREYASTEEGQKHLALYSKQRATGLENFHAVCAAADRGEDTTWLVLTKLLPHLDTVHNRTRNAWIHVAPAITKDIRTWFENVGWAAPENWPKISSAVLTFFRTVAQSVGQLPSACRRFADSPESKGIQSGFLSPMLNAIHPGSCAIVNGKTLRTTGALLGIRHKRKVSSYELANQTAREFIESASEMLNESKVQEATTGDVFDAFCHWYVAIRDDNGESDDQVSKVPIDRTSSDAARIWFQQVIPENARVRCERALAGAIELANDHGNACWELTLKNRCIRLNVGRLLAFELSKNTLCLGFVRDDGASPLPPDLDSFGSWTDSFGTQPETALFRMPYGAFTEVESSIRANFEAFITVAASTARRSPYYKSHSPGVVQYLAHSVGRELPTPKYIGLTPDKNPNPTQSISAVALKQPRTLFKKVDYELANLLSYIDLGDIGLPDLQRPFVWSATKVRDLFDSMYRGYPVGYLLFWSNAAMRRTRQIGLGQKPHDIPNLVIVDGQQRLTSLYAVFRGLPILDDDFNQRKLDIAFRPRDGRFEVTDAAVRRDPEFISSISDLWASGKPSWALINQFFQQLEASRPVTMDDKEAMSHNLDRLFDLQKYPFTALEIISDVDEQSVAEVFVRINSEGVKLNQADFILTLLSVFWPQGRKQLEQFAHDSARVPHPGASPSPFNHLIQPAPDQLLRVAIAIGFFRARLKSVYQLLRAKDFDGTQTGEERRESHFATLREAHAHVLDLQHWHQFLKAIVSSGYCSADMVSSNTALIYSYALFLIGKLQCSVPEHLLQRLVARWFISNVLTGRYSGSFETIMEEDLAGLRKLNSAEEFTRFVEQRLGAILTKDFWTVTLPIELETSSARSPGMLAFYAAQVRLNAPVLFSDKPVSQLWDPSLKPPKASIDQHHLFPRKYLQQIGIDDRKKVNQAANFALVEWPDNLSIGGQSPKAYAPKVRARFSHGAWEHMCRLHALPPGWEEMEYEEFLQRRRALIAEVILRGYESVAGESEPATEFAVTADERQVWDLIRVVETNLRNLVRQKFNDRWGFVADQRMRSILGSDACQVLDKNRAKHQAQYPLAESRPPEDGLLSYAYLGQLIQLMITSEAWELFKPAFRDRRQLEDLAKAITPVRNDGAHFRSVPEIELMRCRVAAADLLAVVTKLQNHG